MTLLGKVLIALAAVVVPTSIVVPVTLLTNNGSNETFKLDSMDRFKEECQVVATKEGTKMQLLVCSNPDPMNFSQDLWFLYKSEGNELPKEAVEVKKSKDQNQIVIKIAKESSTEQNQYETHNFETTRNEWTNIKQDLNLKTDCQLANEQAENNQKQWPLICNNRGGSAHVQKISLTQFTGK